MLDWSFFKPSFYRFQSEQSDETNGFPLGRENVIKIKSERIVAVISDRTWKYQKLSSDPNVMKPESKLQNANSREIYFG